MIFNSVRVSQVDIPAQQCSKLHFNLSLYSIQAYYYYEDSVQNRKVSSFGASRCFMVASAAVSLSNFVGCWMNVEKSFLG